MTTATSTRNATLDLWFLNVAFANVGDASGLQPSATAGSLYLALHTSSPGIAGNQTTNESAYGSYARVAVARTAGGWTRTLSVMANTATATFPTCTSGTSTVTDFSVGTASSGAGVLMFFGSLTVSQVIAAGGTPSFAAGAATFTFST